MAAIKTPESNLYAFSKASVTWHFIEENPENLQTAGETEMNYLASFEADMLNFRNQRKTEKDFISTFIGNSRATVNFPVEYTYCSEGIVHRKITNSERYKIEVKLSVNKTFVTSSKITLWHLSISPVAGSTFSENDLIKLAHNFGSIQEGTTSSRLFDIKVSKEEKDSDISEIVKRLFEIQNPLTTPITLAQSGIIQIDPVDIFEKKEDWVSFINMMLAKKIPDEDLELNKFSKTLCGIILGIFDFERMNEDEIFDTIQPIVTKNASFVVLCRGTLFKLTYNEEICDAINNHIIVDPYLLIPDMVLIHNAFILNNALNKIDKILLPKKANDISLWNKFIGVRLPCFKTDDEHKLVVLEKSQKEIRNALSFDIIYDVFQYPSEREIIKTGEIQRGIESLNNEITQRLNDLSELILVKRGNKTINSDASVAAFLAFITLLQFIEAFLDFKSFSFLLKVLFTFVVFAGAVVIYCRLNSKQTNWFKSKK